MEKCIETSRLRGRAGGLCATSAEAESVIVWRPEHGQFGAQIIPNDAFGPQSGESEGGSNGYDFESQQFGNLSKYYPVPTRSVRVGEVPTFSIPTSLKAAIIFPLEGLKNRDGEKLPLHRDASP